MALMLDGAAIITGYRRLCGEADATVAGDSDVSAPIPGTVPAVFPVAAT
jgi:hypothetical protein